MKEKTDSTPIRILHLEDSARDHELIRSVLEDADLPCTIMRVDNEKAFLDALREEEYDIILSDYRLPGYGGVSAMESARQHRPYLPFIIVSGSIGEEAAIDLIKQGASDYVLKDSPSRLPYAINRELKNRKEKLGRIVAEWNLRKSEEKFRKLFIDHSTVEFIIDTDDGRILEANRAAAAFYGWSIEELQQMYIQQINTSPHDVIHDTMKRASEDRELRFEFQHRKADGSIADVEVISGLVDIGEKIVLHAIVHDISLRKRAEERLHLLYRAVEQLSVGVMITDPDGDMEYVNPGFTAMTGYSADDVRGRNPRLLQSGHHTREFYSELWSTILSGRTWEGEMRNRHKNGTLYWEKAVISPVVGKSGKISHFVSIKEDISRERQLREDLINAKNSAEESDRLKTAFLMNMSHEIRTPMNSILGFMDLLKERDLEERMRQEYIEIINVSGGRLIETLDNIIEISRIEAGELSLAEDVVDTEELLRFLREFFHPRAVLSGSAIDLAEHVRGEEARVLTDEQKLHAVLANLIKNAVKFTEQGSIEVGSRVENDTLLFFVRDTGIGVPENRRHAIFDPFVQSDIGLHRRYEGSGLGLSIARAYVRVLGGDISFESVEGKGSTFTFTIPYRQTAADTASSHTGVKAPDLRPGGDRVLLIAEDDAASTRYLETVLKHPQLTILLARTGEEAITVLREHPEIACILMDLKMPDMDGFEATRRIREFDPTLPIIAQTAYAHADDLEKALAAGCNEYLTKPLSRDALIAAVNHALATAAE